MSQNKEPLLGLEATSCHLAASHHMFFWNAAGVPQSEINALGCWAFPQLFGLLGSWSILLTLICANVCTLTYSGSGCGQNSWYFYVSNCSLHLVFLFRPIMELLSTVLPHIKRSRLLPSLNQCREVLFNCYRVTCDSGLFRSLSPPSSLPDSWFSNSNIQGWA